MMKYCYIIWISLIYARLGAQNFELIQDAPFVGVVSGDVEFSDFDNDGDLDVIIMGFDEKYECTIRLYINDGLGGYSEKTDQEFICGEYGALGTLDFDGDGDNDLIISSKEENRSMYSVLYRNDGGGNFSEWSRDFMGCDYCEIICFDVDSDGDVDIILSGRENGLSARTKMYINDGIGNFSEKLDHEIPHISWAQFELLDLNSDGNEDLFISGIPNGLGPSIAETRLNDGTGRFSVESNRLTFVNFASATKLDFNSDGKEDIFVTGFGSGLHSEYAYVLLENWFGGLITSLTNFDDGCVTGEVDASDIDGDGDVDVLMTGINESRNNRTLALINQGDGVFTQWTDVIFDSLLDSTVDFADIDGDGDEDLLITGISEENEFEPKSLLFENRNVISSVAGNDFKGHIELFPNPAMEGKIYFRIISRAVGPGEWSIKSVNGSILKRGALTAPLTNNFTIDISELTNGIYFLECVIGAEIITEKLVVQNGN